MVEEQTGPSVSGAGEEGDGSVETWGNEPWRLPAPELDRLPPPAFPPGGRRSRRPTEVAGKASAPDGSSFPEEALILPEGPESPGEAGSTGRGRVEEDPSRKVGRRGRDRPGEEAEQRGDEEEAGIVTGIGTEGPLYFNAATVARWDPEIEIAEMAKTLEDLAGELREKGGTALLIRPDGPPLESTIRGLIAGFLLRSRS